MELLSPSVLNALSGGILIGFAATLLLFFNGRVAGISGIYYGIIQFYKGDVSWRIFFVLGLLAGGTMMGVTRPELFENTSGRTLAMISVAGILVGFGSVMGAGCTSGHGICGVSRLSKRSIIATLVFMAVGMIVASGLSKILGAP